MFVHHFSRLRNREEALYLPRVPHATIERAPSEKLEDGSSPALETALNFDPISMWDPYPRFLYFCFQAIKFSALTNLMKILLRRRQFFQLPFIFLDGILEWISFLFILVIFPLGLLFYAYLVIDCQKVMTNTSESWLYHPDYAWGG